MFRFDIGYNFVLDNKIQYYMTCLGDVTRFKKTIYCNYETIQYSNSTRSIIFYDKLKEARKSKVTIPEHFQNLDGKILRYELQFKRRLANEFDISYGVKADYLYNRDFLNKALEKWKASYFSIRKIHSPVLGINPQMGHRELLKSLASIGVDKVGYDEVLNILDSEKGNLKRQMYSRLKKCVRELISIDSESQGKDYIKELDGKVMNTIIE
jgi:hypothetical protein